MISPRVQERRSRVLELICWGVSVPKIAHELKTNPANVRKDVRYLLADFGADSMAHLAAKAVDRGVVKMAE